MGLAVERFMDCAWEYIVFDRDAKGVAARIGRRLVLPARSGQLPPVGVPIRPTRIEDKGKFLVAHGPWVVPTGEWLATVVSDSYVSVNATPVGAWFAQRVTLPLEPNWRSAGCRPTSGYGGSWYWPTVMSCSRRTSVPVVHQRRGRLAWTGCAIRALRHGR
jgi:hypothetical protein